MKIVVICANCNTSLPSGSDICPKCGQELCPHCGSLLEVDATTCQSCGTKFDLYCPQCDAKVGSDATTCHVCGLIFEEEQFEQNEIYEFNPSETDFDALCNNCQVPIYWSDGFCLDCGLTFCPFCGHDTDDEMTTCPGCSKELYFDCPICSFLLTVNTEYCPNCNALFPKQCNRCLSIIEPGVTACPTCKAQVIIRQRVSARTVKTMEVGEIVIRIVACPGCGRNFDPLIGECPHCRLRICKQCQIVLEDDEPGCPRCGDLIEEVA